MYYIEPFYKYFLLLIYVLFSVKIVEHFKFLVQAFYLFIIPQTLIENVFWRPTFRYRTYLWIHTISRLIYCFRLPLFLSHHNFVFFIYWVVDFCFGPKLMRSILCNKVLTTALCWKFVFNSLISSWKLWTFFGNSTRSCIAAGSVALWTTTRTWEDYSYIS